MNKIKSAIWRVRLARAMRHWTPVGHLNECWLCSRPGADFRDVFGTDAHLDCLDRFDAAAARVFTEEKP